jgi:hypothetical protein
MAPFLYQGTGREICSEGASGERLEKLEDSTVEPARVGGKWFRWISRKARTAIGERGADGIGLRAAMPGAGLPQTSPATCPLRSVRGRR